MDRKQPAGCIFLQQDNKLFAGGLKSGVSHIQGVVCSKTTPVRRTRNGKIRGGDTDGEESGIIENNHYKIGKYLQQGKQLSHRNHQQGDAITHT